MQQQKNEEKARDLTCKFFEGNVKSLCKQEDELDFSSDPFSPNCYEIKTIQKQSMNQITS